MRKVLRRQRPGFLRGRRPGRSTCGKSSVRVATRMSPCGCAREAQMSAPDIIVGYDSMAEQLRQSASVPRGRRGSARGRRPTVPRWTSIGPTSTTQHNTCLRSSGGVSGAACAWAPGCSRRPTSALMAVALTPSQPPMLVSNAVSSHNAAS